jgi:hypothetical protein
MAEGNAILILHAYAGAILVQVRQQPRSGGFQTAVFVGALEIAFP